MLILERLAAFAVGVMIPILASCLILAASGCGMSRGWNFHVGVNPVSEVKDEKILRYEEPEWKVAKRGN